jgi:hypothetical protein
MKNKNRFEINVKKKDLGVIEKLIGKTITKVELNGVDLDECKEVEEVERVLFYCSDETVYSMYLWKKSKTFYI